MPFDHAQIPIDKVASHGSFSQRLAPEAAVVARAVDNARVPTDAWGGATQAAGTANACVRFEEEIHRWLLDLDDAIALYGGQLIQLSTDTARTEKELADGLDKQTVEQLTSWNGRSTGMDGIHP